MEVGGEGEGERRWRGKRRDGEREGGRGGVVGGGGLGQGWRLRKGVFVKNG
jgi:hypothetical protein